MSVHQFYQRPSLGEGKTREIFAKLKTVSSELVSLETEYCYYVEYEGTLNNNEKALLRWLLTPTFNTELREESVLRKICNREKNVLVEVGPRLNFSTAFSTNAVSICNATDLKGKVKRIERSTLYLINSKSRLSNEIESQIASQLFDRMTEQ
ncbi:phosphoribosylformylglycinamidine synthase-like protein, partial [Leptotrombidium deliense]